MSNIIYTKHANEKFEILERHGFEVTRDQVVKTVMEPDKVIPHTSNKYIAQKQISRCHVLRVVYRHENKDKVIITFYSGRKERYED